MEIINYKEIETIKPKMCGYITQNGNFYPTIGFDAVHGVGGDFLWMQQDLIKANEYALSRLDIPFMIDEYQKLKDSVGKVDITGVIDRYIADKLATIKFARLHEERYGNAKDKTVYPCDEGFITVQALVTLSWLYGINYNPNTDFEDVQTGPVKRLQKRIGTIAL